MFKNQNERYMTRGIAEAIHPEMALFLWHLIDRLKEKEMEIPCTGCTNNSDNSIEFKNCIESPCT